MINFQEIILASKDWSDPILEPKSFGSLAIASDIKPNDYLNFAERDLSLPGVHGLVNCLSNSKRAIDCQIENILVSLGLQKSGSFPKRIERIQRIGLLAPRIVRKVVILRNKLEHEFYKPEQSEVEDALDVATLFVSTTNQIFRSFMEEFWVAPQASANRPIFHKEGNRTYFEDDNLPESTFSTGYFVNYCTESKNFEISWYSNSVEHGSAEVRRSSPSHLLMVKYVIENNWDHGDVSVEESGAAFINLLSQIAGEL